MFLAQFFQAKFNLDFQLSGILLKFLDKKKLSYFAHPVFIET